MQKENKNIKNIFFLKNKKNNNTKKTITTPKKLNKEACPKKKTKEKEI